MRILHIVAEITDDGNGLALFVQRLAEAQANQGDTVNIFTHAGLYDPTKLQPRHTNPIYYKKDFALTLSKYAKEVDIFHIHGCWTYPVIAAAKIARKNRLPYIISTHGALAPVQLAYSAWKKNLATPFQRSACKHASLLHAASSCEAEWISNFVGTKAPAICTIPCGIESPPDYTPKANQGNSNNILYLGRLHPLKGIDILLEAFAASGVQEDGATLTICGRDEAGTLAMLKKQAHDLAIEGSINFLPAIPHNNRWELISKCDALVLPSQSENFGMTIGEALIMGKPVIATKNSYWQMLDEESIGFTIGANPNELSEALVKLVALPPNERIAMGQRGATYIKENLTWDNTAAQLKAQYSLAIEGGNNG